MMVLSTHDRVTALPLASLDVSCLLLYYPLSLFEYIQHFFKALARRFVLISVFLNIFSGLKN